MFSDFIVENNEDSVVKHGFLMLSGNWSRFKNDRENIYGSMLFKISDSMGVTEEVNWMVSN